ncbi:MerR family transcriptional regulator [Neobacillus citreus]|uniref:Helix-turn-helix domain-containing protein n=1 Tax=Neobacillus citreus TaxID=2833578 RepID=A0A942T705_9BACI|nr:MerR family transcriptional regulator [Neobacillus citreus]MCH6264592.1 helix-turn-helix domain-containing protein [Neobacillus citreus]
MTEIYSPSDVQKLLEIDASTLRKYATLLEGNGYLVHRNNRGHRIYFDKDVHTFRKLMEFSKQEGMTMEHSAEAVMKWVSEEKNTDIVTEIEPIQNTSGQVVEHNCNHEELMERIEHLEQINLDLIKLLKEKAVREACQEEKINQILRHVEYLNKLEVERIRSIEKEIAAATQKKWWNWFTWKKS